MKKIIPNRLKRARVMKGLSMNDLCSKMDNMITKQALSKYEKGLMQPREQILEALSLALDLPVGFFSEQESIVIGNINFRTDPRLPMHAHDQMISTARDKIERYLKIEDLLCLPSSFTNPIKNFRITAETDIESASERIRKKWNLGCTPIFSVYEMLENVGVKIIEFEAGISNIIGFSTFVNESIPLIVINLTANKTTERKRFTALHELGHLILNLSNKNDIRHVEHYCNLLSGAVLCPATIMFQELGHRRSTLTLNELVSLKCRYGISVAAAVHRAKDLGIISENYYNYLFDKYIHSNRMEEGWGAYPIQEHTDRFERLLQRAVAEKIIDNDSLSYMTHDVSPRYLEKIDIL